MCLKLLGCYCFVEGISIVRVCVTPRTTASTLPNPSSRVVGKWSGFTQYFRVTSNKSTEVRKQESVPIYNGSTKMYFLY